jgi:hypothetical protein
MMVVIGHPKAAAPVVDDRLAELLRNEPDPLENLVSIQAQEFDFDPFLHTQTPEQLLFRGRLVRLECGHFKITKAMRRSACPRCGEMLRSGWDHDGFRRLGIADTFSWPGDPLRQLHEQPQAEQMARFDPTNPR